MDGRMAAQSRWATEAAMGKRSGRQRQRRHDPDGRQWWWCNGWQDGIDSAMAITMNGGGSKEGDCDSDEGGGRATAMATKWPMATFMRVAGDEEGNGDGGKSNCDGVEGGG
jgi:hypothetical protein